MLSTSHRDEYLSDLLDGDIIAFDSLSSVSRLVQWADSAPVNHVGIYLDGQLIMANKPEPPTPPALTPGDVRPAEPHLPPGAIVSESLEEVLKLPKVRAATTLRHRHLSSDALARLRDEIDWYRNQQPSFHVNGLLSLAVPALSRAYWAPARKHAKHMKKALYTLGTHVATWWGASTQDTPLALTCSEFVYRCFGNADIELDIRMPLDPRHLPKGHHAHPSAEPLGVRLKDHNKSFPILPDLVTPGDLWRSPSLRAHVYYVKDPSDEPFPPAEPLAALAELKPGSQL